MLTPQLTLGLHHELAIDLFAGGGGASTGIEQALGRPVDVAINHDPEAVALHSVNHPQTRHYTCDVFEVDPLAVTEGRPVGVLWASPLPPAPPQSPAARWPAACRPPDAARRPAARLRAR